ncbi:MAG: GspH/FimT family pseudopilin [Burkholderiales bacterium]|nr:GspH/FimT family pseudopilin [Burkholderiales bacterium]
MLRHPKHDGFTLLELLASLGIAAALLLLGIPGYAAWIAEMELRDRVEALVGAMSLARSEAIKRNARVNLCPSGDGARCADNGLWEAGWLVFADDDRDGERGDDETVLRVQAAARPLITVRGNKPVTNYVSYTGFGHTRMVSGALQMGTFTICRTGRTAVDVVLANGGRVRVERTKLPCP